MAATSSFRILQLSPRVGIQQRLHATIRLRMDQAGALRESRTGGLGQLASSCEPDRGELRDNDPRE